MLKNLCLSFAVVLKKLLVCASESVVSYKEICVSPLVKRWMFPHIFTRGVLTYALSISIIISKVAAAQEYFIICSLLMQH